MKKISFETKKVSEILVYETPEEYLEYIAGTHNNDTVTINFRKERFEKITYDGIEYFKPYYGNGCYITLDCLDQLLLLGKVSYCISLGDLKSSPSNRWTGSKDTALEAIEEAKRIINDSIVVEIKEKISGIKLKALKEVEALESQITEIQNDTIEKYLNTEYFVTYKTKKAREFDEAIKKLNLEGEK